MLGIPGENPNPPGIPIPGIGTKEDAYWHSLIMAEKRQNQHNKNHKLTVLQPGMQVYVKTHKLSNKADKYNAKLDYPANGPYIVLKEYADNVYTLYNPGPIWQFVKIFAIAV